MSHEKAARARYEATRLGVENAPAWENLSDEDRANHIRLMGVAFASAVPGEVGGLAAEWTSAVQEMERHNAIGPASRERLRKTIDALTALSARNAELEEAGRVKDEAPALAREAYRGNFRFVAVRLYLPGLPPIVEYYDTQSVGDKEAWSKNEQLYRMQVVASFGDEKLFDAFRSAGRGG